MTLTWLRVVATFLVDRNNVCQLHVLWLNDPDLYIFDDSFSALDYKTDATLRQSSERSYPGDATVLIVAQRVGTIMDADQIIVLGSRGNRRSWNRHEELMESNEIYREIANSQFESNESLTED